MALKDFYKKIDKNAALFGVALLAIVVVGALMSSNSSSGFSLGNLFGPSNDQVAKKTIDYINSSGLSQNPASLVSVSEESGLVKLKIKIGSNEFDSYVTKDGKFLFPQAFDMTQKQNSGNQNANTQPTEEQKKQAAEAIKKSDKPLVEAFVVARCPFGLQMQRAMAEAVKNIPSLADYFKVRYIGSVSGNTITAMHGEAEAKENLRQICIREEQPAKYWPYVACQMKASGTETSCQTSTGVDTAKLNACISDTSRGVAYAKKDFDLASQNNVSGSPTMIMSNAQVSEFNFGGRTADAVKSMACAGFNSQPGFCSTKLSTTDAATSFSQDYASSNTNSGNSGANGANCAPAQ
jgi:hypothetical protein